MKEQSPLPPLREVIAAAGLTAHKSLGQNFLFDLNLTQRIAREAGVGPESIVIEIGPGPGGLTRSLLAQGARKIIAIERDERCRPVLEQLSAHHPGRIELVMADALKVDEAALLKGEKALIVANLPYNIATPLLMKWLMPRERPLWLTSLTLMFQKEVAERIVAPPRASAYGRLSVASQWRMDPRILFNVHRSAFTPPPKVTSTVVAFTPRLAPRGDADAQILERVTAAAFGQRRKMLRSSLKSLGSFSDALLADAQISPEARAEEISVEGFTALARALAYHSDRS